MDFDSNRKLIAAALAAAGCGDRKALQTVYRLTAAKLFAVCMRILGEHGQSGHHGPTDPCPLLEVKRTWNTQPEMSAFDPKRT
jgi:hypothetical protein